MFINNAFWSVDVVKRNYREALRSREKCAITSQFNFQWDSLTQALSEKEQTLQKAIIRTYIQVIQRHFRQGESVNISLLAYMDVYNENNERLHNEPVFSGQHEITVTNGTDQWIEMNLTEGASGIWQLLKNCTRARVFLKAQVDCIHQKKVPFNFVNPAAVPLSQVKRKERLLNFQPFLVLSTRDEAPLTAEEMVNVDDGNDSSIFELEEAMNREKRSSTCALSDFSVTLQDIASNIVYPYQLNIRKCSGYCSHSILRRYSRLGTNHAKIMASMYLRQLSSNRNNDALSLSDPAKEPCCVPKEYASVYVYLNNSIDESAQLARYNNFIATSCACM